MQFHKINYHPEANSHTKNKIKFELDLYNSATQSYIQKETDIDTLNIARKADWASKAPKADKFNVE